MSVRDIVSLNTVLVIVSIVLLLIGLRQLGAQIVRLSQSKQANSHMKDLIEQNTARKRIESSLSRLSDRARQSGDDLQEIAEGFRAPPPRPPVTGDGSDVDPPAT